MTLPTTATWTLADFHTANLGTLLDLPSDDLAMSPARDPYFTYNTDRTIVHVRSNDESEAALSLRTGVPPNFTFECLIRCPALPNNLGDLHARRVGFTVADDAGKGFNLYFAKSGVALSRVDDFGAVTALPDTSDVTQAVAASFFTIRVAIDGRLGRAYVFVGQGDTLAPALRWIVPTEPTPAGVTDRFRLFAQGTVEEPVHIELMSLRLASYLVIASYPPTANAGPDRVAAVGQAVRFDGRASYDIEGAPLSFKWQCIEAPFQSQHTWDVSDASTKDDGDEDGVTAFITVDPGKLPDWLFEGDIVRLQNKVYEVLFVDVAHGELEVTSDAVPDDLTNVPLQLVSQRILRDPGSPTPTVLPDVPGLYRFRLTVDDGDTESEPSEVLANIAATQASMGIEPDVSLIWHAIGDEWRFIENSRVFEEAWIGVAQYLSGQMLDVWQHHYNISARDAQQVFQRKWLAYRTLVTEGAPEDVTLSARHGAFVATFPFHERPASVAGLTLEFEILEALGGVRYVAVTFSLGTLEAITEAINEALGIDDIQAVARASRIAGQTVPNALLVLWGTRPFRLFGSACAALGLAENQYNLLGGTHGAKITDRTYYVDGIDLRDHGVQPGDLLVLNNGESFRIDRVLSDVTDPHPGQRLLLNDPLPFDASAAWTIPSVFRSTATNYEDQGVYPGDLFKTEAYATATGAAPTYYGWVVAQKEKQLALELSEEMHAAALRGTELRTIGVKLRHAVSIPADVVSIPTLQAQISSKLEPLQYQEQVDYVLEPFYRGPGGAAQPMLQFREHVFADPLAEPADVLWAETTLFDNAKSIEDLHGHLVGFMRDDAASLPPDFNYISGVFGLLYAQQRGPSLFAMAVGAQILLGQPFAEVGGQIVEIDPQYSAQQGRMLVMDDDRRVRAYYYAKSDSDQSPISGLGLNPDTDKPWAVGEQLPQFSAIGGGVSIEDIYSDRLWWRSYVGAGIMREVEKYHRFAVRFDTGLVPLTNLGLLHGLITRIKPTYTRFLLAGEHEVFDDIDVVDDIAPEVTLLPYDTMHVKLGYRHDDYMGDGRISVRYDDGVTRHDGLVDNVLDTIEACATIQWPGGALNLPHASVPFQLSTPVIDINGTHTGVAGKSFSLTNGMSLPQGAYRTCIGTKTGPILPL